MKRTFMALGAAILVAGAITFGSCEKQTKNLPADNLGTPGAAKTNPTELTEALFQFWHKCDSVYVNDSSRFITTCDLGGFSSLMNMVGVSDTLIRRIDSLSRVELGKYLVAHPELDGEVVEPCPSCMDNSASNILEAIRAIRYYANLMGPDGDAILYARWIIEDYGDPSLRRCLLLCEETYAHDPTGAGECSFFCHLMYWARFMQEMAVTYSDEM